MKVLLAEYTVAHDPSLAHEGAAMLAVPRASFERCGYEVVVPGPGDFGAEITRLAPDCGMGLVIAPDRLLSEYTFLLEQATHNLGCGFMTVALCANKVRTGQILAKNGIPVPGAAGPGKRVIKPVKGCGRRESGSRRASRATGSLQRSISGESITRSALSRTG